MYFLYEKRFLKILSGFFKLKMQKIFMAPSIRVQLFEF